MNKSDNIDALAKALSAAQAELKPAVKNAENPFFHSTYADLASVWDAARAVITKHGLAVTQVNGLGLENTVIVETVLMHESGQWLSGELVLPLTKMDAQGVGSAIMYGRRYGLAAIIGIVADTDDDGNAAVSRPAAPNGHATTTAKQPFNNSKPTKGTVEEIKDLASDAQLTLLKKKAKDKGVDIDAIIGDEFPECQGVGDLNKRAASYLIDKIEKGGK